MFGQRSLLVAGVASLAYTQALSSGCTAKITSLAIGDLGSCLQLLSLLPVLSETGSIVPDLNTYLTSFCSSSTPTCSNTTLNSAQSDISSACASDIAAGGTDGAEISALGVLLADYPEVRTAGCSTNSSTGAYCVTDTLSVIQTDTKTNLSVSFLTSIFSGNSSSVVNAVNTGDICTGCTQVIYTQSLRANASLASSTFGQALTSQCGSSFGTTNASGVATGGAAATPSASSTTSSSKSAGGREVAGPLALVPAAVAGVAMVLAMAVGGSIVL